MRAGDEITITPAELVAGGAALAKIDGFPIFATNVYPGDVAVVRLLKVKKGFAHADLVRLVEPSPFRRAIPCPVAAECGGCDWTALRLDKQLEAKTRILTESLRRVGKIDPAALPPISIHPSPLNYRLRSRLHRDGDKVGFFATRTNEVVQLPAECEVVGVETARALGRRRAVDEDSIRNSSGGGRDVSNDTIVSFRTGEAPEGRSAERNPQDLHHYPSSNDTPLFPSTIPRPATAGRGRHGAKRSAGEGFSARATETPHPRFADLLPAAAGRRMVDVVVPESSTLQRQTWRNPSPNDRSYTIWEVDGKLITDGEFTIDGYHLSTDVFFQVNRHLLGTMRRLVSELSAHSARRKTAVDLYSGAGFFSRLLAEHFESVTAVEGAESAHEHAKRNVPENVTLVNAPVEWWVERMPRADFVFLDPPRSGAKRNVIDAIASRTEAMVCFLACDPVTFARDASRLIASGWRLASLDLLDLFPNTHHVETLASFERANPR